MSFVTLNNETMRANYRRQNLLPKQDPHVNLSNFFYTFSYQNTSVIELLIEGKITNFRLHALIFMASTTFNFRDYFCYNIHVYNVVRTLRQNKNCDN